MNEYSPEAIAAYPEKDCIFSVRIVDMDMTQEFGLSSDLRTAFDRGRAVQREADAMIADSRHHPDDPHCEVCRIVAAIRQAPPKEVTR